MTDTTGGSPHDNGLRFSFQIPRSKETSALIRASLFSLDKTEGKLLGTSRFSPLQQSNVRLYFQFFWGEGGQEIHFKDS